jgi:hypothetical protein
VDLGGKKATFVSAGRMQCFVITEGGDLLSFARNEDGQLGLGDTQQRNSPTHVDPGGKKATFVSTGALETTRRCRLETATAQAHGDALCPAQDELREDRIIVPAAAMQLEASVH